MAPIGLLSVFPQQFPLSQPENALLFTTLAFALVSFFCSTFTTLRTLLPLVPPHPLKRRSPVGPYSPAPPHSSSKPKKLKSAQRFSVWLAILDVAAIVVLVWEAALAASGENGLGGSRGGASRLYVSCAARPTLLLVVALISYINVVHGRSISLGAFDCIVWGPALAILVLGAGLASIARVGGKGVWIGLACWLSVVTLTVTLCFVRLLVAILRVRKLTQRQATNAASKTPWMQEQERFVRTSISYRGPGSYLPPLLSNFSGLTTSFIGTAGQSNSSIDDLSRTTSNEVDFVSFTAANAPAIGYAPSRPSTESEYHGARDFRSPTPGSSQHLLSARPFDDLCATPTQSNQPGFSFEELPRPSFGSYASATTAGGFVGNSAVRQAITREVWGNTPPPGSGSPKVELSSKEARGAIVRIGGHLASCLMGYALICPFVFMRVADPTSVPPLAASIALVASVCQSGVVLAFQCWLSEGFWFSHPCPPTLNSSSAAVMGRYSEDGREEMRERAESRASSVKTVIVNADPKPPSVRASLDINETRMGQFGRVLSMAHPHPKLIVLPTHVAKSPSASSSGFTKGFNSGHARLRSLTLAKTSGTSLHKERRASVASRTTVGGYEHHAQSYSHSIQMETMSARRNSAHFKDDGLVTKALLSARKQSWSGSATTIPFGFGNATSPRSTTTASDPQKLSPAPSPTTPYTGCSGEEFGFRTREFTLSPTVPTFAPPKQPSPTDYTIDYLSSQILPRLVPSVKVGSKTRVDSEHAPIRQPARAVENETEAANNITFGTAPSGKQRNYRNLSLPGFSSTWSSGTKAAALIAGLKSKDEAWVEVEQAQEAAAQSPIVAITQAVRSAASSQRVCQEDSPKDRSSKAWDLVESGGGQLPDHITLDSTATPHNFADHEETEILQEEDNYADESSLEDGHAQVAFHEKILQTRRSASPLNKPLSSPSFAPRFVNVEQRRQSYDSGSVVLRGSQAFEEDDDEVATVHCATVRPVSRLSTASMSSSSSGSVASPGGHSRTPSYLTSQGFANLMEQGKWHHSDDEARAESSEDAEGGFRRPSFALRPRDVNSRTSDVSHTSESDGNEGHKKGGKRTRPERPTSAVLDPCPIPPTIEEVDEDKRSGTPTPRASRTQRKTPAVPEGPLSSTPPGRTATVAPPAPDSTYATTRSRTKNPRGPDTRSKPPPAGRDENVAPRSAGRAGLRPRAIGGGEGGALRGLR